MVVYIHLIPPVPAGPPVNVRVENASSYSVLVEWLPPEVPNGIITYYFIYINYKNGTEDKRQVNAKCSLYQLEELKPYQKVGIRISASTIAGEGLISAEKSTRTNEAGLCKRCESRFYWTFSFQFQAPWMISLLLKPQAQVLPSHGGPHRLLMVSLSATTLLWPDKPPDTSLAAGLYTHRTTYYPILSQI